MTAREAIAIVRRIMPNHDVCVHQSDWHYSHLPVDECDQTSYRLSIQPGLNGQKCSGWDGENVQDCVERLAENISLAFDRAAEASELAAG